MLAGVRAGLRALSRRGRAWTRPAPAPGEGAWFQRDEAIMGTAVHVEVWGQEASAQDAMAAVIDEMHRIDECMSPFKPGSELSQINDRAGVAPVRISDEMFGLLARAQEFSECSDGAFDITYAGAGHLYDYRQRIRPSEADLERARAAVGYRGLVLDSAARSVRFARPGMRIDLGGFAKGYAVENGAAILCRHGISNAIVTAGGDSRILGDRRGRPWMVGVRDPRRAGELAAVLPLSDIAVSTSGDYERFFEEGGERFHHILDPRTGKSPSSVHSVTVIAADGLCSEALSKIVFVLGVERGLPIVEQHAGADAVVVDAAGVLHASSGLGQGRFQKESAR